MNDYIPQYTQENFTSFDSVKSGLDEFDSKPLCLQEIFAGKKNGSDPKIKNGSFLQDQYEEVEATASTKESLEESVFELSEPSGGKERPQLTKYDGVIFYHFYKSGPKEIPRKLSCWESVESLSKKNCDEIEGGPSVNSYCSLKRRNLQPK